MIDKGPPEVLHFCECERPATFLILPACHCPFARASCAEHLAADIRREIGRCKIHEYSNTVVLAILKAFDR